MLETKLLEIKQTNIATKVWSSDTFEPNNHTPIVVDNSKRAYRNLKRVKKDQPYIASLYYCKFKASLNGRKRKLNIASFRRSNTLDNFLAKICNLQKSWD